MSDPILEKYARYEKVLVFLKENISIITENSLGFGYYLMKYKEAISNLSYSIQMAQTDTIELDKKVNAMRSKLTKKTVELSTILFNYFKLFNNSKAIRIETSERELNALNYHLFFLKCRIILKKSLEYSNEIIRLGIIENEIIELNELCQSYIRDSVESDYYKMYRKNLNYEYEKSSIKIERQLEAIKKALKPICKNNPEIYDEFIEIIEEKTSIKNEL